MSCGVSVDAQSGAQADQHQLVVRGNDDVSRVALKEQRSKISPRY